MKKCRYCGREAAPEFRFCPHCGGELTAEGEADVFLLQKPAQGEEVLYRSWEEVCVVPEGDTASLVKQDQIKKAGPAAGERKKPEKPDTGAAESGTEGGEPGTRRRLVSIAEAFPGDNVKIGGVPWKVLWVRGERKLLLAQQSVGARALSETGGATWEGSSLRRWLNRQYLEGCFSKEEQEKILPTEYLTRVTEQDHKPAALGRRRPERTSDRVGILSCKEFNFYASQLSEEARKTFFSYESPGLVRDIYVNQEGKASASILRRTEKGEEWGAADIRSVSNVYPVIWYCV